MNVANRVALVTSWGHERSRGSEGRRERWRGRKREWRRGGAERQQQRYSRRHHSATAAIVHLERFSSSLLARLFKIKAFPCGSVRLAPLLTSPRITFPKNTLDMNWALPRAARRLCAAKPKDTKLSRLPPTKKNVPTNQIGGFLGLAEEEEERDEEEDCASSCLLWPNFYSSKLRGASTVLAR